MKKKTRNIVILTLLLLTILISSVSTIYAYSKGYSFEIRSSVTGKYNHELKNKTTKNSVSARAYNMATGNYMNNTTYNYSVAILKSWSLTSYSGKIHPSNGLTYTDNFGKVKKGKYSVKVMKHTNSDYGKVAKGSGKIKQ